MRLALAITLLPALAAAQAADTPATTFGAYGELHYESGLGRARDAEVDLRRLVFELGHRFDERFRFVSETALEHGGEQLEVEQAFVEWRPHRAVGLRAGLVLVPVGAGNVVFRDPTTFHGVDRSDVDRVVLPTTWREPGVSAAGEAGARVRWELAFLQGMNAGGFAGDTGLRRGRGATSRTPASNGAVAGRVELVPMDDAALAASFYAGGASRPEIRERVAVRIVALDARGARHGASLRAQWARVFVDGAEAVNDYLREGALPVPAIGDQMQGWYLEAAYDVLTTVRPRIAALGTAELHLFVREEATNTQLAMSGGYAYDESLDRAATIAGATLRPRAGVVVKADYVRTRTADEDPPDLWRLGVGWSF